MGYLLGLDPLAKSVTQYLENTLRSFVMDLFRTPDLINNIGGLYLTYPNFPVSSGPNPCAPVLIPVLRS